MKFLQGLALRALGGVSKVEPRVPSRFAPNGSGAAPLDTSIEREVVVGQEKPLAKETASVSRRLAPEVVSSEAREREVMYLEVEPAPPRKRRELVNERSTSDEKDAPAIPRIQPRSPKIDLAASEPEVRGSEMPGVKAAAAVVNSSHLDKSMRQVEIAVEHSKDSPSALGRRADRLDFEPKTSPRITENVARPADSAKAMERRAEKDFERHRDTPISVEREANLDLPHASDSRTVQVQIGRVEVRAVHAPAPAPRMANKPRLGSAPSLSDYLAKHKQGWS